MKNDYWTVPEKVPAGGLRTYFFGKKNPVIFMFITLPLEILDKTKLYSCKFCDVCFFLE